MDIHELLLNGLWRDQSMLALPAWYRPRAPKKLPSEGDYVRSRITYAELFGAEPTWEEFFERLRGIGLHSIMAALSYINSVLYVKGALQAQTEIVNGTFDSEWYSFSDASTPHAPVLPPHTAGHGRHRLLHPIASRAQTGAPPG